VDLPGGTVTFLFTDIENSSHLWETQPERMAAALTRHNTLLKAAIEANSGIVFKTMGDGFCAVFASPLHALTAAVEAQQRLTSASWDDLGSPLLVRMGLHSGTPECRDGDYFGPSVNRVARVCDLGHGGQILLTRAVHELLGDLAPTSITFRSLNAWRLKGMTRPETIYQVEAPDLPANFPPLRSVAESVGNLPELLASFVGRAQEMSQITQRLDSRKLLTLRGAGGCGKTRLAIEVARPLTVDFPGGVWLIRLDALHDPDLIPREVARTLRLYVPAEQTVEQALISSLCERSTLLILDNCEHLRAACARFAHELLSHCPDLRILATSREALGVPGEHLFEVHPLRLPKRSAQPSLAALRASEAIQLFTARAEAGGRFTLTRDNATAVADICRALDGIPLALEMAARWVGILPLEEIARELGDLINEPPDDQDLIPLRQQTMRATVDWSFNRLEPDAQALFLNLAVFVGGFTLEAARAMNPATGTGATHVLRLLKGLVERSFVQFDEKALPDPRYRLLEPIREVAVEKLLSVGGENFARDQHRDWFLSYALRAEPELQGTHQTLWVGRLEADQDNFRSALKWSVNPRTRLRLAMALHRFWLIREMNKEGRAWLEGAFAQAVNLDDTERANTLNVLGIFAWAQTDIVMAQRCYEESLAIYERLNLLPETAKVLNNMAIVAKSAGESTKAIGFYEKCLTIYRSLKDERHIRAVLNNLGVALTNAGDYSAALPLLEESLRLHRRDKDESGEATALYNMGDCALFCKEYGDAERRILESLALFLKLGEEKGVVLACVTLASVYLELDRQHSAAILLSAAQRVVEHTGSVLAPDFQQRFDKTAVGVKQALTPDRFDFAWHEGQTRTPDQIVAELLSCDQESS
jgi:predicted ATPase/class 3 adenylate cyclase/Tfp pilus assembly protein PilF